MKMYCVAVRYFIPTDDEDDLNETLNQMGVTDSEYYGSHDVMGFEDDEEED